MHGLYIGALMFLGVIIAGTTAYCLEGWKFSDAFYMVIITVFSVGYEEVEPVATPMLRAITIFIIVAGDASKVYFVGSLVRFITEGEIGKAMDEHRKSRDIETISDHAIICGYGRIGQTLARELTGKNYPFLIVDNKAERVALAQSHGYQALLGDAGEESTLNEAHIERALVLATVLPSDMVNVFITLTARNMRPDLRIIARAEDPATEKKLKQVPGKYQRNLSLPSLRRRHADRQQHHPPLPRQHPPGRQPLPQERPQGTRRRNHRAPRSFPMAWTTGRRIQQLLRSLDDSGIVLAVRKPDGTLVQHLRHPPARSRRHQS